ncbi:MAG: hypothetical protein MJA29_03865, partial [Candidatus Omnitrophica bacterium]|nr:hypothetical protein [Candidatus Omnitrophota bacterium]
FILATEVLASALLNHPDIKGIRIDQSEFLLSQFADDMKLLLEDDVKSFRVCFEVLDFFADCSGLQINYDKTVVVRLGANVDTRYLEDRGLKWQFRGKFKMLGIIYDLNCNDYTAENFEKGAKAFESSLNAWSARNLTVYGRITVIKSLALSKLVHLFTSLPTPSMEFIQRLQRKCFQFIWSGKVDKIKRTTMYNGYEEGGFKVPNIEMFCKALKISWVKRLTSHYEDPPKWLILFATSTADFGGHIIWSSTVRNPPFLKKLNPFWRDVYDAWFYLASFYEGSLDNSEETEFLSESIFYNKNITSKGVPFFYREWWDNQIVYLNDLVDETGKFYDFESLRRDNYLETTHFLQYASVLAAIPGKWKRSIQKNAHKLEEFDDRPSLRIIRNIAKPSRFFYQ